MPTYEFLCTVCDSRFEERRPMADSNAPATCSEGHPAKRLLSSFAATSGSSDDLCGAPMGGRPPEPCHESCACF